MNLPQLARKSIKHFLKTGSFFQLKKNADINEEFLQKRGGVFVSLHTKKGELRGCIGTFAPTKENVAQEVIYSAVSAATRDPRFYPITEDELSDIKISVDVLGKPEKVESKSQLDCKKYGVLTMCGNRTGLLLPDIDGIKSVDHQLEICCQKAGISPDENFEISRFKAKRFSE